MSPTQQERRIQALYDDANVSRRYLCERVVHLEADMEDVRAENAKLRDFIRLKEMCWKHVGFCYECPYNGVDDEHYDCNCTVQEETDSLARELGIEV